MLMIVDVGDVLQPPTDMSIDGKLQEETLQQPAAEALAEVIVQCVGRKPSPNEKLIKNLCALTCADPVETPKATEANAATVNIEDIEATPVGKVGKNMKLQLLSASEERSRLEGAITRRGAEFSLKSLCEKFGDTLLEQLPKLWECLTEALGQPSSVAIPGSLPELTADPQALITNLQVQFLLSSPCADVNFLWGFCFC